MDILPIATDAPVSGHVYCWKYTQVDFTCKLKHDSPNRICPNCALRDLRSEIYISQVPTSRLFVMTAFRTLSSSVAIAPCRYSLSILTLFNTSEDPPLQDPSYNTARWSKQLESLFVLLSLGISGQRMDNVSPSLMLCIYYLQQQFQEQSYTS